MALPILYSYRRCPYAMRARMALKLAGILTETREISLREKPMHMLAVSPKGTVPVLILPSGQVLEQSVDIMLWALGQCDDARWLQAGQIAHDWVQRNDIEFKPRLDAYKYPERHPQRSVIEHRQAGEGFLQALEQQLSAHAYVCGETASIADIAIFPFIRQFAAVDANWFAHAPYPQLRKWLQTWLDSSLFASIMQKHPSYVE